MPEAILKQFHFTFLIRHPRYSIPSYYRCTVPPLDDITGFYNFMPSEAGYDELRRTFDYLREVGQIGPKVATRSKPGTDGDSNVEICVVDADDLLDDPAGIIEAYCKSVGLDYDPSMLNWGTEEDHAQARDAFEKWNGFHNDAIESSELKPRQHVSRYSLFSRIHARYKASSPQVSTRYMKMANICMSDELSCTELTLYLQGKEGQEQHGRRRRVD